MLLPAFTSMPADLSSPIEHLAGRYPALDSVMRFAADNLVYALVVVVAAAWFHRDGLRTVAAIVLGAIVALAVGAIIAGIWTEQRPFVAEHFTPLIAHSADASFPSDHLLALGAVAGATWWRMRGLAAVTVVLSVIVAFARVFVGVHYVGDVAGGFAIGFVCGAVAWLALGPLTPLLTRVDAELGSRLRPVLWGGPARPHAGGTAS